MAQTHDKVTTINETNMPQTAKMPSADLINYRFDQTDSNIRELKDLINVTSNSFVSNKDAIERDRRISVLENANTWIFRAIAGAIILGIVSIAFHFSAIGRI